MVTEVYKSLHGLNPVFMADLFALKQMKINLRSNELLSLPSRSESTKQSFLLRAILSWNNLPRSVKECKSLTEFKSALANHGKIYCQCKICL